MFTSRQKEIATQIEQAAGIINGYDLNGVKVYFHVHEMREKIGNSVYRTQPSGRYQINVPNPYENRDRIFRTKKADGSFNIAGVIEAIKVQYEAAAAAEARRNTQQSNTDISNALVEEFNSTNFYISKYQSGNVSYCASANCAPSTSVEGNVSVQVNFGDVDADTARKILAFAQSIKG
jgi:hypothetical protein